MYKDKVKNPRHVKKGDKAIGYNGFEWEVIAIVRNDDWEELIPYDELGWLSETQTNDISDYLVALKHIDHGEAVFTYGEDGAAVYETIEDSPTLSRAMLIIDEAPDKKTAIELIDLHRTFGKLTEDEYQYFRQRLKKEFNQR